MFKSHKSRDDVQAAPTARHKTELDHMILHPSVTTTAPMPSLSQRTHTSSPCHAPKVSESPSQASAQRVNVLHRAALESIQGVALEAVMPMFKAMVESAEEIILRLHSEDFGQERQQGMTQASAYMQALTAHVNHCR